MIGNKKEFRKFSFEALFVLENVLKSPGPPSAREFLKRNSFSSEKTRKNRKKYLILIRKSFKMYVKWEKVEESGSKWRNLPEERRCDRCFVENFIIPLMQKDV